MVVVAAAWRLSERSKEMSAYGEFETIMREDRFLVEGLTAMGYKVEVHADGAALVGYHGDERHEKAHVIIRRVQLNSASNVIGGATQLRAPAEDVPCPD